MTGIDAPPASSTARYALFAILLVAAMLRVDGLGFGLPALYDADEPLFVLTALKLLRNGTLNPGWFGHPGSTTLYALALVDIVVLGAGLITGRFADLRAVESAIYADPGLVVLPGRAFVLLCALAVIALTWVIARRLFGAPAATLAAALLALDPIHLRYSQIIRTDMHATVFMLLCGWAAIGIAERGRLRDYLLAGLWLGLAIVTKWPAAVAGVAIGGAALLRVRTHPHERAQQVRRFALAMAATLAAMALASPYLLIDYATVVENLQGEARRHHPGATGHGLWGNAAWYVAYPLRTAFGPAGLVLALVGCGVAARANRVFRYVFLPFAAVFFLLISAQTLIWERWTVPLLPLLSITTAVAIVRGWRWLSARVSLPVAASLGAVVAVVLAGPLILGIGAVARERDNDTRRLASAWALRHVAPGSTVLVEHLALDLARQPWRFLFPVGEVGCVDALANLQGRITYTAVAKVRGQRPIVDVGNIDPARARTCRSDVAILVNYDRYLQEPALYARELATYRTVLRGMRTVAVFRPLVGLRGGPPVRVLVMSRKTPPGRL